MSHKCCTNEILTMEQSNGKNNMEKISYFYESRKT